MTRYVKVKGYEGVAWTVTDDTEEPWTLCMVGDDKNWKFDPEECESLDANAFCSECGQTGCQHGREDEGEDFEVEPVRFRELDLDIEEFD
jgi:hypothetical protein